MNSGFVGASASGAPPVVGARTPVLAEAVEDLAGLQPVETLKRRWPMVLAALLTLAMVVQLARQLLGSGLDGLSRATPDSWAYYVAFLVLYLTPPIADYVIFRRLWRIPIGGLAALTKKRIANEVVIGYSGEAYFYAWARQRSQLIAAPFGAVKDVMILSAMAGNAMTLLMTALALPLAYSQLPPNYAWKLVLAIPIVIAMSLPFLLFSRRVFSLDRRTLWWIFFVHMVRLGVGCLAIALAWHFALPGVAIGTWLILSATRMMVGRLPFIPNKELVFSMVMTAVLGAANDLTAVIAFTAALTLVVHVVLAAGFGLHSLIKREV